GGLYGPPELLRGERRPGDGGGRAGQRRLGRRGRVDPPVHPGAVAAVALVLLELPQRDAALSGAGLLSSGARVDAPLRPDAPRGSGHLAAVTDSEGRKIVLTSNGGLLTSVALPDGSLWRLGYSGEELGAVFDPLHSGSTPWRTFTYQPDGHGVVRLLTAMRD